MRPRVNQSSSPIAGTEGQLGGVIEREGPIHISNVMLLDTKGKPDARAHRTLERQARARRQAHRRGDRLTMAAATADAPPARLKARYFEEIRPKLIERFGYSSVMQAPRLEKITLNMGVGEAKQDSKVAEGRDRAARDDRRPAAERAPRAQVDRRVQTARGHARRRRRDASR